MSTNAYLAELAGRIAETPLTMEEREEIRYKLLDWTGCAVAGAACRKPKALISQYAVLSQGALVIGSKQKGSAPEAAFCNGFSASYLEFEDTHKQALAHPGGLNVAAALATCELQSAKLGELFRSVIAGYEIMLRLGLLLNPSHYERWHTTGTCGVFGAAAAACVAKGMDREQTARALGVAANMSSGFRFTFGTDAKTVNAAHPAMCGIMAADMARIGFTAPDEILTDALLPLMSRGVTAETLTGESMNERLWLRCAYKSYASCGHTHTALDCWNALIQTNALTPDDILRVEVDTFPVASEATGQLRFADAAQARFSLPYCMAATALLGGLAPQAFTDEARSDRRILQFAERITVRADGACALKYPRLRPAVVTVWLKDGGVLRESREMSLTNPPRERLRKKYHALTDPVVGERTADAVEQLLLFADESLSVKEFCNLLQGAAYNQAAF